MQKHTRLSNPLHNFIIYVNNLPTTIENHARFLWRTLLLQISNKLGRKLRMELILPDTNGC